MKHKVKVCGAERKTSKKGSVYYVVHFVEKMEGETSYGYRCTSAFCDEEQFNKCRDLLNKEIEVAYFWGNGTCRLIMIY